MTTIKGNPAIPVLQLRSLYCATPAFKLKEGLPYGQNKKDAIRDGGATDKLLNHIFVDQESGSSTIEVFATNGERLAFLSVDPQKGIYIGPGTQYRIEADSVWRAYLQSRRSKAGRSNVCYTYAVINIPDNVINIVDTRTNEEVCHALPMQVCSAPIEWRPLIVSADAYPYRIEISTPAFIEQLERCVYVGCRNKYVTTLEIRKAKAYLETEAEQEDIYNTFIYRGQVDILDSKSTHLPDFRLAFNAWHMLEAVRAIKPYTTLHLHCLNPEAPITISSGALGGINSLVMPVKLPKI